jgi:hypothetical protein
VPTYAISADAPLLASPSHPELRDRPAPDDRAGREQRVTTSGGHRRGNRRRDQAVITGPAPRDTYDSLGTAIFTSSDRLWSVQDVADYLGIPNKTLYNWRLTREDLLASCLTTSTRVLSPIDTLERDAIIRAVIDANGNRK